MEIMEKQSLTDYQIGILSDLDFMKIFEDLNKIKEGKIKSILQEYRLSYTNSLFTPLCLYSIEYLNDNEENPKIIGKSKINDIGVIYIILNQTVYDLFFLRKKGKIFPDVNNEIDYDINFKKENYYDIKIEDEKEYDFEGILSMVNLENNIEDTSSIF